MSVFITDDDKESDRGVLLNPLQGREKANYEFPLYTKGGRRIQVLLNATTRRDIDGRRLHATTVREGLRREARPDHGPARVRVPGREPHRERVTQKSWLAERVGRAAERRDDCELTLPDQLCVTVCR